MSLSPAPQKLPSRAIAALLFDIINEILVEIGGTDRAAVAGDDEQFSGAGHGDIHSTKVAQKTYLAAGIGAHQRNINHISLLPLKTVDGFNLDRVEIEFFVVGDVGLHAQHLLSIGRN